MVILEVKRIFLHGPMCWRVHAAILEQDPSRRTIK